MSKTDQQIVLEIEDVEIAFEMKDVAIVKLHAVI
jgi:hypothetical protein